MELSLATFFISFYRPVLQWSIKLILIQFVLWASLSDAKGSLSHSPSIKIATGSHYSPYVDEKLPGGGWSTSIITRVLEGMSLKTDIMILPWDRALKWTIDGKVLGSFPFVYSKKRAEQLIFSMPINYVPVHMYVSKQSGFSSLDALSGKRLCFPLDYDLSSIESQIISKFSMTVNRVKDGIGCIKHVQKGWSDAGLINGYINTNKMSDSHWQAKHIHIFEQQLALVPLYFVVGKGTPNAQVWMDEFNFVLADLDASGELDQINLRFQKQLSP